MDKKTFAWVFVILFGVLTYYLWQNNDSVAGIIANDGWTGIAWYIISNPAYILLMISIYLLNRETNLIRNAIGSFLIIYSSDIISYPRLPSSAFPQDVSILASSDGLIITKLLKAGFSYETAWNFYYLVLPIGLVIIALAILGVHNFYKQIKGNQ